MSTAAAGVRLQVAADEDALAQAAAGMIATIVSSLTSDERACHVALAGGSTPQKTYEALGARLERWEGLTLWLGDERCVPGDDERSNLRLARRALGEAAQIEGVDTSLAPAAAAADYAQRLAAATPAGDDGLPVLDLALCGMGPDGHTASLFPGHPVTERDGVCVEILDSPKPPPQRVTLTLGVHLAARTRLFLVAGESKRDALAEALHGPSAGTPSARLMVPGTVVLCDRAAAPDGAG